MTTIGFGGGCHWCTEAVFASLKGVVSVRQGWIASDGDNSALSEGVLVDYDPSRIGLDVLIEIHLRTHASTSLHSMRGKFRSAVYTFNAEDSDQAAGILENLRGDFDGLITQVLPFYTFEPSRDELLDYYGKDPQRPFCKRYIDPKLALLRDRFSGFVNR